MYPNGNKEPGRAQEKGVKAMEYQIRYFCTRFFQETFSVPGTFSADEQTLRLRGYAAVRQRQWVVCTFTVIWAIWFPAWVHYFQYPVWIYFGLPLDGSLWDVFVETVVYSAPLFVGLLLMWLWPTSNIVELFERRFITSIGRQNKKISFDMPNPSKPGKLLHVKFKAKSIAEAELIEQALLISKAEVAPEGREVDTSPDAKGQEIVRAISISPDVERDILSGRLSKRDIMIKYAIRAEELEEMYKMLAEKR